MNKYTWLVAAMLIGMLAACSDEPTTTTDTDTASSSGGDTAAGTDTTAATDAGGEAVCLTEPATPTGGWGAGCTAKTDLGWLTDADNSKAFPGLIRGCTLGGCAGAGDDAAIQKCIGDCIKDKSKGLSQSCSDCYGTWAGWCGFKKCISVCAVDDGTDSCDKCLECHCTPNRDACTQLP